MVKDGWYCCPACGKHIQKVGPSSVIYGTELFCRSCKQGWYPTILNGEEMDYDHPFLATSETNE